MKKLGFLLAITLSLYSCGLEDDAGSGIAFNDIALPIESVSMPSEFVYGQTYLIEYSYYKPSNCHTFLNLFQEIDLNVRTVAVISRVFTGPGECVNFQDELVTRSFNITVDNSSTYVYRFWHGEDANGQDVYLQMEIPVIE